MRRILLIVAVLIPLSLLADDRGAEPAKHPPAPQARQTMVIRLKNVPAEAAGQAISHFLNAKRELSRLQGPDVAHGDFLIEAEAVSNSLLISAAEADLDEIKSLIRDVDRPRDQIHIEAAISLTNADGRTRVLSRPKIRTLDGAKCSVSVGLEDGTAIKLELVPRIVREGEQDVSSLSRFSRRLIR